ncbi:MAG: TetR/AcrR family transcriptional regulator [Microthrixaceae bacterium]
MARRSLDERRSEYLDIGAEIIAEAFEGADKDPALALSHVKLADVAERAGVTKGALYHIWESQEAFWQDLLNSLLDANSDLVTDYLEDLVARPSSSLAGIPTMYDHADAAFRSMSVNPALYARIGLVSYLSDEGVRQRFDDQYQAALALYRNSIELAIASMGRRLREGTDLEAMLVSIDALLEGLCLNSRVSPDRTPTIGLPDGSESTLYAVALEAIVVGYTEPISADGPQEVPLGAMADIAVQFETDLGSVAAQSKSGGGPVGFDRSQLAPSHNGQPGGPAERPERVN